MCFLGVPEESRLSRQAIFMILESAPVLNGHVNCPMSWFIYKEENSYAGLLLRLKRDGYLQSHRVEKNL